jgi:MFS transporter, putative metabolite:H+ symporter
MMIGSGSAFHIRSPMLRRLFTEFRSVWSLTVVIAGLGYFVDSFDLSLYAVVRQSSLNAIGITDPGAVLSAGLTIYNAQMAGLMLGGVGWGLLADRRGRVSVLFGSILLYSLASIANAFVRDVPTYALCRFVAGVGLAGELGAAITLVAEQLPAGQRGVGTTVVATMGLLGVTAAALFGQRLHWQATYIVGGVMGLLLLVARLQLAESTLFTRAAQSTPPRWRSLLQRGRWTRYTACVLVGVPMYFATGVLLTFAPEIAAGLKINGPVSAANAILFGSIGLAMGDLVSGLLSQRLRSRKKVLAICLLVAFGLTVLYTQLSGLTPGVLYALNFLISATVGYWAVLLTLSAEQFGTNVRGLVATTVPNFVRGSALFAASGFGALKTRMPVPWAALTIAAVCFAVAALALTQLDETFDRDLDYVDA